MYTLVLNESGYEESLYGLSLSYNSTPSPRVAQNLAFKGGGHNKFLESIVVWLEVAAPRYWWSQFDTYRVGTTKQSESTMHTLMKSPLTADNFEGSIKPEFLDILNELRVAGEFVLLKQHLPESFIQLRVVCTNYKVLQNIIQQRSSHKLQEWQHFISDIRHGVEHPRFLFLEGGGAAC